MSSLFLFAPRRGPQAVQKRFRSYRFVTLVDNQEFPRQCTAIRTPSSATSCRRGRRGLDSSGDTCTLQRLARLVAAPAAQAAPSCAGCRDMDRSTSPSRTRCWAARKAFSAAEASASPHPSSFTLSSSRRRYPLLRPSLRSSLTAWMCCSPTHPPIFVSQKPIDELQGFDQAGSGVQGLKFFFSFSILQGIATPAASSGRFWLPADD